MMVREVIFYPSCSESVVNLNITRIEDIRDTLKELERTSGFIVAWNKYGTPKANINNIILIKYKDESGYLYYGYKESKDKKDEFLSKLFDDEKPVQLVLTNKNGLVYSIVYYKESGLQISGGQYPEGYKKELLERIANVLGTYVDQW